MTRTSSLALGAIACLLAAPALAQDTGMGGGAMPPGHPGRHQMMSPERMQAHQQMMEQMQAHQAKLDELVAAMNAAEGEAKVDAIAAVVNELVDQQRSMRAHAEQMRQHWKGKAGSGGEAPATP